MYHCGTAGALSHMLTGMYGAIVEFRLAEDGLHPFLTDAFNSVGHGVIGLPQAGDGDPAN